MSRGLKKAMYGLRPPSASAPGLRRASQLHLARQSSMAWALQQRRHFTFSISSPKHGSLRA
eukprot:10617557-Alexandrium_andersonii.AAC.1